MTTSAGTQRDDEPEDLIGTIQLEFTDWDFRRPAREILADIRERTADLAGILVVLRKEEAGPPVGKPVQIQVAARDIPDPYPSARKNRQRLPNRRVVDDVIGTRR